MEERDREGYVRQPQTPEELTLWQAEVAWPEDCLTEADCPTDFCESMNKRSE